jgi:hypothetical protein
MMTSSSKGKERMGLRHWERILSSQDASSETQRKDVEMNANFPVLMSNFNGFYHLRIYLNVVEQMKIVSPILFDGRWHHFHEFS